MIFPGLHLTRFCFAGFLALKIAKTFHRIDREILLILFFLHSRHILREKRGGLQVIAY
jgi:hypothetical protein